MSERINYYNEAPQAFDLLMEQEKLLQSYFEGANVLNTSLWELIKLRVSQINQCAFCLEMHSTQAISYGESYERIVALNAWQDSPFFSDLERQALLFAEHLVAGKPVESDYYDILIDTFGGKGLTHLTLAINAISSWNKIVKVYKPKVGSWR